jgi:hypothetical protein
MMSGAGSTFNVQVFPRRIGLVQHWISELSASRCDFLNHALLPEVERCIPSVDRSVFLRWPAIRHSACEQASIPAAGLLLWIATLNQTGCRFQGLEQSLAHSW